MATFSRTAPGGTTYQRRTVIVKRSLQFKYVGIILLTSLIVALIASSDTLYTMYKIAAIDNPALAPILKQVQSMILVKVILFLGITILVALFFSHRFAGPVFRFEKSAQIVASGDLTHRVSLRTGDELLDLQEEFNNMVASLQALVERDRRRIENLSERLESVLKDMPEEGTGSARQALKAVRSEIDRVTAGFKI